MAQSEGKIGSLFYGMTLDTSEFKKNLKDARKKLGETGKWFRTGFASMAKSGALLATAAVAASTAMLVFSKNVLEATNAQLILADSIGATQEEVAGLELSTQKWGVETNMVIDKMREAGGLSKFKDMAEQVKTAGSEVEQLAMAQKLFGNEGLKMLPLLQQGAQGFANMEAEARALGLALSPEQIAKSRVAWEEYESTIMSIKGLGKQIGTAFLEPLGLVAAGAKSFIATFKTDIIAGFTLMSDVIAGFIRGAFDLFTTYGIPFINGFISFAGQIGDAFSTLFEWMSPATNSVLGGLGSLFSGVTAFISTFKQSLIIGIATPIQFILRSAFSLLRTFLDKLGDLLTKMAFGLAHLKVISEKTAEGVALTFGDADQSLKRAGDALSKPFTAAIDTAMEEMVNIFIDQDKKNSSQVDKFKGIIGNFEMKFGAQLVKLPVIAVNAAKEMAISVSEKMSGMILSGSQAEQNIINQTQDKMVQLATKSLRTQEKMLAELQATESF